MNTHSPQVENIFIPVVATLQKDEKKPPLLVA
jgi:hypothetical protein